MPDTEKRALAREVRTLLRDARQATTLEKLANVVGLPPSTIQTAISDSVAEKYDVRKYATALAEALRKQGEEVQEISKRMDRLAKG